MLNYESLTTQTNTKIFYYKILPSKPKAMVIISHGYAGHSGQYATLANFLVTHGYGVYAYDHRGHGRSQETRGHVEQFENFVTDLHQMVLLVQTHHPNLPIFTYGHSMGGLITFHYGLQYAPNLRGQLFTAPALDFPWGTKYLPPWFYRLANRLLPHLKLYALVHRPISRNPAYRQQLREDPYVLKYSTVKFFYEFIYRGIRQAKANAHTYQLPCLFLHGTADKLVAYPSSVKMVEQITSKTKTLKLYDGLYHELVQEPESQIIMEDMLEWLETQTVS